MENYYELLEISENASQEVIERVYKLLAKKYHPDLNPDNPKEAEEKFKKISAAYEVLSNESKRKSYDEKLRAYNASKMSANAQSVSNYSQSAPTNNYKPNVNSAGFSQADFVRYQQEILRQQREKLQKQYDDAYVSALNKLGIKVVYKKPLLERIRDKISTIIALLCTFIVLGVIIIVLWFLPFTHDKMQELYDNSGPVKFVVETISKRSASNLEDSEVK